MQVQKCTHNSAQLLFRFSFVIERNLYETTSRRDKHTFKCSRKPQRPSRQTRETLLAFPPSTASFSPIPCSAAYFRISSVIIHALEARTAHRASSFAKTHIFTESYDVARRRGRGLREENSWVSSKPDDDDGFAALAQLESA